MQIDIVYQTTSVKFQYTVIFKIFSIGVWEMNGFSSESPHSLDPLGW
jgi:hypothetical protein